MRLYMRKGKAARTTQMNWFKRLIDKYSDHQECGEWGVYDVETRKVTVKGKMFSRTIKVEREDGSIGLDTEWVTDEEKESEQNGQ